jgi:uncharacterized membrane protein
MQYFLLKALHIVSVVLFLGNIITGVALAMTMDLPILGTKWILWALIFFGVSGAAFGVFVAPLQKKLLANARAGLSGAWDEPEYRRLSKAWGLWGGIATAAPLVALFLMVFKPT